MAKKGGTTVNGKWLFAAPPFTACSVTGKIFGIGYDGDLCHVADTRGWGYLTGNGAALGLNKAEAIAEQKVMSEFIAEAMNAAMTDDKDATIARLTAKLAEVTAERDRLQAAGTFAQGIEAAAKACADNTWRHEGEDAYSRGLDRGALEQASACAAAIRALSPTPQTDPVREAVTERMIDAAFNALPPDAHGTIGSGEMYRVIEAALAQKGE